MIRGDGWHEYSIWEHSQTVRDLYTRRCRLEAEEMDCAAQAAEILAPLITPGDTLLDVGCGSGYFYHSLRSRRIPTEYYGIDGAPSLIEIGRRELPAYGLDPERLQPIRIEELAGSVDHVLCMNVISNIDNYHRPLERLLRIARKSVLLRESCAEVTEYHYVRDDYLDEGVDLRVYVNTYSTREITAFIQGFGYRVTPIVDRRTGGEPELVIGYPHRWTFLLAEREPEADASA